MSDVAEQMTQPAVDGSGATDLANPSARTGEQALTALAVPLNVQVLRVLSERPMRLSELRQAAGLPAQTTLRGHLAALEELAVVGKQPTQQMPYAVEIRLAPMGEDLLTVGKSLQAWLQRNPRGPIQLDSSAAKGIIKAFVDGWSSTIMRSLALRPMSLTELDREIVELSYPSLERRLSSMRMAGLIEARRGAGSGTPYGLTDWARESIRPLANAARWELTHLGPRSAPVTQLDIEAAFLLAAPLADLAESHSGICQLEVRPSADGIGEQAGVRVQVDGGRVVSCECGLERERESYAMGTSDKWFTAVKDGTLAELTFGGGEDLVQGLVIGMHKALVSW
jgi:DNA-binding HxlR family transcriptional regulator